MSAATMDTNANDNPTPARRSGTSSRRTSNAPLERRSERELTLASDAAELAVVELINGSYDALRAFVPQAVLRPTQAVDYVFDLAEQMLGTSRRVCMEIASIVEAGVQGSERASAA